MSNKNKNKCEYSNSHLEQLYNRFLNLALNRFKWENLPIGMKSRHIEKFLIEHGQVMFSQDEYGVYKCLPCHGSMGFDIYGDPLKYQTFGYNGETELVDISEGVVIRNNSTSTADKFDIMLFSERIDKIERTMDLNLNAQKTPYVILCDEKERLTFKSILSAVDNFKYAIMGSKKLGVKNVEVLNTKSEYLLDKLREEKNEVMNELLTFLGINNNNTNKKERLLVDEVNANNDFILVNIDHMYEERLLACEEINKKYGLDIKVSKREIELGDGGAYGFSLNSNLNEEKGGGGEN